MESRVFTDNVDTVVVAISFCFVFQKDEQFSRLLTIL